MIENRGFVKGLSKYVKASLVLKIRKLELSVRLGYILALTIKVVYNIKVS